MSTEQGSFIGWLKSRTGLAFLGFAAIDFFLSLGGAPSAHPRCLALRFVAALSAIAPISRRTRRPRWSRRAR